VNVVDPWWYGISNWLNWDNYAVHQAAHYKAIKWGSDMVKACTVSTDAWGSSQTHPPPAHISWSTTMTLLLHLAYCKQLKQYRIWPTASAAVDKPTTAHLFTLICGHCDGSSVAVSYILFWKSFVNLFPFAKVMMKQVTRSVYIVFSNVVLAIV